MSLLFRQISGNSNSNTLSDDERALYSHKTPRDNHNSCGSSNLKEVNRSDNQSINISDNSDKREGEVMMNPNVSEEIYKLREEYESLTGFTVRGKFASDVKQLRAAVIKNRRKNEQEDYVTKI